jgi:putative ABC transport system substrate-binding protein
MQRRQFLGVLGGAAAWPFAAHPEQPERPRRIGVIMGVAESDPIAPDRIAALKQSLSTLGWREGRNIDLAIRWSASDINKATAQAEELIAARPDVLIAHTLMPAKVMRDATHTIPIVFTNVSDPDGAGLVKSVSHPGGNITGFSNLEPSIGSKWLEILHEIAPAVTRVAVPFNPEASPVSAPFGISAASAAAKYSLHVEQLELHSAVDIEPAITRFAGKPGGGLIFPPDIFIATHRDVILELAAHYSIPAIYPYRFFVDDGGLISYGTNAISSFAQAATYVDRILKGANPADLPVQAPTAYELIINLKTATALGLTVQPTLLALADGLIQ